MKTKILELLKSKGQINLTDFRMLIPESKGDLAMYLPMKEGYNQNVLISNLVTVEFIEAWNQLVITEMIVDWIPVDIFEYLFCNSPIIVMPLATMRKALKSQKHCFLPTALKLKK
jgi:hypothetical protein